jgi:hypothetical protein
MSHEIDFDKDAKRESLKGWRVSITQIDAGSI